MDGGIKMYDMAELNLKKQFTLPEAAFYIGISLPTLHKLMKKDDFKARVEIGEHRVFINKEILDGWLDSKTGKKA